MKLLFVGESWLGSSARALKEGMKRRERAQAVQIDEINEDLILPRPISRMLRGINRLLMPAYRRELTNAILAKCRNDSPSAMIVYKGNAVQFGVIRAAKALGIFTVNVFPDCSPHAQGRELHQAIGEYDLVVSTKPFHPPLWKSVYGFSNECIFVPHGYDPDLHYRTGESNQFDFDVGLAATWRPEYQRLMKELALGLAGSDAKVAIAGNGWQKNAADFPTSWRFPGPVVGMSYPDWARRCKIMIAPVSTEISVAGRPQPGDQDSTRTYELAASHCFFIHRRTPFVTTLYEENTEVPMFDDARELCGHIDRFLRVAGTRNQMAAAAHARAVPAYSTDARAEIVIDAIRQRLTP